MGWSRTSRLFWQGENTSKTGRRGGCNSVRDQRPNGLKPGVSELQARRVIGQAGRGSVFDRALEAIGAERLDHRAGEPVWPLRVSSGHGPASATGIDGEPRKEDPGAPTQESDQ
jgi:hypothetical protein